MPWQTTHLWNSLGHMWILKGMIIYIYLIGLETRWRPGGDLSPRDVCWRLAGSPGPVAGNSNMIFGDLFPVSSRRLGDVSATSPRPAGDQGDWGDMRRRCGDDPGELVVTLSGDVALVRAQAILGLPSRPSCHDWSVAVTSPPIKWCQFQWLLLIHTP